MRTDPLITDERFLAAHVRGRGVSALSACSHAGVVNTCLGAMAAYPGTPIDVVLGSYHLAGKAMEVRIDDTVRDLLEWTGPSVLAPGHRTGWRAKAALSAAFAPGRYAPASSARASTSSPVSTPTSWADTAPRWQTGSMGETGDIDDSPSGGSILRTVTVSRSIATTPAELWAAISTPGNLEYAHPFCDKNPVTAWPGPDARDEVHYLSGWVYERTFTDWIDGVGYDLRIGSPRDQPSEVWWRIADGAPGRSDLTITIRPRPLHQIPRLAQRPAQFAYIRPLLRRYLSSVVDGFEWWVTTGDRVAKNQFGRHPWFSEHR